LSTSEQKKNDETHDTNAQLHRTTASHDCVARLRRTTASHDCVAQLHRTTASHDCVAQLHRTTASHDCVAQLHRQAACLELSAFSQGEPWGCTPRARSASLRPSLSFRRMAIRSSTRHPQRRTPSAAPHAIRSAACTAAGPSAPSPKPAPSPKRPKPHAICSKIPQHILYTNILYKTPSGAQVAPGRVGGVCGSSALEVNLQTPPNWNPHGTRWEASHWRAISTPNLEPAG
jgi:hypothetical protein